MILNLNKDFFFGALIWLLMIEGIGSAILGLIGEERSKKYSSVDNIILAAICLGWILA